MKIVSTRLSLKHFYRNHTILLLFYIMNIDFHSCIIPDWCYQKGTSEQYTGCQSASKDGRTCYHPQIKYGNTYGGRPANTPGSEAISSWCQQVFPTSTGGTVMYDHLDQNSTVGLSWCSEYDEKNPHWCDSIAGFWKDTNWKYRKYTIYSVTCQIQ